MWPPFIRQRLRPRRRRLARNLSRFRLGFRPYRPYLDLLCRRRGFLQVVIQAALLIHKSLDDPRSQRCGRLCSPATMFHQDNHGDIRITARGDADKPGVGAFSTGAKALHSGTVVYHLRRACLAGKVDVFQMRRRCRTAVGRERHALGDGLPYCRS